MTIAHAEVVPCPPESRAAALQVLYHRTLEGVRANLVAEALADAARGELDLTGLWIARRRGKAVGAMLTQALAGRVAAIWPPEVEVRWNRRALTAAMVREALANLRDRGYRIAQALVDPAAPRPAADDLARGGLPHVTELVYLGRSTADPLDPLDGRPLPPLDWRPYHTQTDADFREVLAATYEGSLDMPELEGVRSLDDVLASHRAGGRFDPRCWQVGHAPGEPQAAAILLMVDQPDRAAMEVSYLGLTPPARGRGLGRAALAHALTLARPRRDRLELAVDLRNDPAVRLYRAGGFRPYDRRIVHLTVL